VFSLGGVLVRISFACAALAASCLTACQSVPAWKNETSFPFRRPIVEAMCEIAASFDKIRDDDNFPGGYYVVTITLESKREDSQDVSLNTSYRTRDAGDDYFQIDLGRGSSAGIGAGRVARRISTTPITAKLTDLSYKNPKLNYQCRDGHAVDTMARTPKDVADFGLGRWFHDVMLGAPTGIPDGVVTLLHLEYDSGGSVFPSWRFVRGFIDPSIGANYLRYDQLKVEMKTQPEDKATEAGVVTVTRGKNTTEVPAISTESYRNMQQQRLIIGN
jgi:hypothetical protein